MRIFALSALLLVFTANAFAWDWQFHYRIAVGAGIHPSAAHGVSYPDMVREIVPAEYPRHYMNEDFFPAGYVLGNLPITYATFAAKATLPPNKVGVLLYEILHYASQYRRNLAEGKKATASESNDFNENQLRLSHYIGDLYMPLHLTKNYNGQLTSQKGAHERFEDFGDQVIKPVAAKDMAPFKIESDQELWRLIQHEAAQNRKVALELLALDQKALACGARYLECFSEAAPSFQQLANRAAGLLTAVQTYLAQSAATQSHVVYEHRE